MHLATVLLNCFVAFQDALIRILSGFCQGRGGAGQMLPPRELPEPVISSSSPGLQSAPGFVDIIHSNA